MFRTLAGGSIGARGCQKLWAYTRDVVSWPKRLISLAMVVALSGSPAVLSACMALCLGAAPMPATNHSHRAPAGQTAEAPAATVVPVHSHHGASASPTGANVLPLVPDSSTARLGATCDNCCPDGVAVVAGPGVERTDAHAFAAAPMLVPVARFLMTTAVVGAAPHGPPVSPPAPPLAPLVLRV